MSASSAGAIKAHLESQGLGVSVFRDYHPSGASLPYVTVSEGISVIPDDHFNPITDSTGHVSELAQVNVWQRHKNPVAPEMAESYTLPDAVLKALHGVRLSAAPKRVFQCDVDSSARMLERKENIVHTAITVRLRRVL